MSDDILVRRAQLPLPRRYVAPRTVTEEALARIWLTTLCMDCVGVEDRFHDLGGDSFMAMEIFAAIEKTFRIRMPLVVLAEAATIAELAPRIDVLVQALGGGGSKT